MKLGLGGHLRCLFLGAETPSLDAEGVERVWSGEWEVGRGYLFIRPTMGSGERHKLLQWGLEELLPKLNFIKFECRRSYLVARILRISLSATIL